MAEFDSEIIATVAYAEVDGSTTPTYISNRGFTPTIVRNGAGDYTHTLDVGRALDDNVMGVFVSPKGPTPFAISSEHQSNNQIRVRMIDVIYAQGIDGDYYIRVVRITNSFT